VGDAVGDHARLARARAREHEQRAVAVTGRFALRRIELGEIDHEPRTLRIRVRAVNCYDLSVDRYEALVAALRAELPGFRIARKDASPLNRAIDRVLRAITLGRMRDYLATYTTTIGRVVYVTADFDTWDADRRYVTLRHEAVHLRQFRRFTFVGMALLYVLFPLPLGLAWFRARCEKQAYAETIRAAAEVWGRDYPRAREFRDHVVAQFIGSSYGWMWPFRARVERWYDHVLATLDDTG
jgi:hypothetical protein